MEASSVQEQKYRNMVESPLHRLIITLAVPSVLSLLVTSFYNLADTFFVGQIGTSATAAVGVAYPLMTLTQALGLMFGKGTGTRIAMLLGNRDTDQAEDVAVLGLGAVFGLGTLLAALGLALLSPLVTLLGATQSMVPYARAYLLFVLIGVPFKAASVTLSSMLRFQGFFYRSMLSLSSGAVLNLVLDPLFIFVFNWGVAGAAGATLISEVFAFVVLLLQFRAKGSIRIRPGKFRIQGGNLSMLVKNGVPSLIKNGLSSVATILLNTMAGAYGDAAVAGFSIVARYMHMCQTIYFGVGESYQSVCSFNYGAKRFDRVRDGFWVCLRMGFVMMIAISLASWIFAADLVALFRRDDAEVIRIGAAALKMQLLTLPLIPVSSTAFVMLQGIGKSLSAMLVGTGRQGMFLVPILISAPYLWGLNGILAAQPVSDLLAFALAIILVRPVLQELKVQADLQIGNHACQQ